MTDDMDDERLEKRDVRISVWEQGLIHTTGAPDVYVLLQPAERREFMKFESKITKRDEARRLMEK